MAHIALSIEIEREGDAFTAFCSELGTASCGDTEDEALENIVEAVTLHLNTLEKLGQRERVFREAGIEVVEDQARSRRRREPQWEPARSRSVQFAYA